MTGSGKYRESDLPEAPPGYTRDVSPGRKYIAVIGINDYQQWNPLNNAVGDAEGVSVAFERLGFVAVTAPLLNKQATLRAIHALPYELKPKLRSNDTLVVFFAGDGHTARLQLGYGDPVDKGYLIPVDAEPAVTSHSDDREHTWHRIDHWLTTITELPPRHILVILDSCYSGIALDPTIVRRKIGERADGPRVMAHQRLGRWVLTSARGHETASDSGPDPGHSAFTGFMIRMLTGRAGTEHRSSTVNVDQLADYIQHQVLEYCHGEQEPVLGHLEFHDHGKLLLPLEPMAAVAHPERSSPHRDDAARALRAHRPAQDNGAPTQSRSTASKSLTQRVHEDDAATSYASARMRGTILPNAAETSDSQGSAARFDGLPDRTEGWALDPPVAGALDLQGEQRRLGAHVLTVVAGDAMASQTSWGTWAARHGYLILATQAVGLNEVLTDLLAQTPWLRCVPEARRRLAAAARIDEQAVDATFDSQGIPQQRAWIDRVAPLDAHARVSGWILSSLRRATACVPDLATAPVGPAELLAIACDLASPTAMLLFHPTPDERWLERAIVTAAELIPYLPAHSVAVTAPEPLVSKVLGARRRGAAFTMARQGLVKVESDARRIPGRARRSTMRVLFDALERDPRTRGRFELDGKVRTPDGPAIDVEMVAPKARIAVELDAWYHFHDPAGYRRDRVQDMRLQRAGYFVLRFPAEDVDDRLAPTVEQLAIALAGRRAVRALP